MADLDLLRKLLIKPGSRVVLLDDAPAYRERFTDVELTLYDRPQEEPADVAVLFAPDRAAFDRRFDDLIGSAGDGVAWVCYPKRSGSDLNREGVRDVAERHGWRPVTQIAVDEAWSAMRIRRFEDVGR